MPSGDAPRPGRKEHWERVHASKGDAVSWYQAVPAPSLRLVDAAGLEAGSQVIDVGAGASPLVEALLDRGLVPTLLDLSESALQRVKERLGERAGRVAFRRGDVTRLDLPAARYELWHDRAVFHFLTDPVDRRAYLAALRRALRPGGWVAMGTFAADGPETCSGLPVCRYDAAGLAAALGAGFRPQCEERELHPTPFGTTQSFQFALFRLA